MKTGTGRCPSCDEPISEGTLVHRCSVRGDMTILDDRFGAPNLKPDLLGETVAYQGNVLLQANDSGSSLPDEFDDGFPAVDDLIDQTLGQYKLESVVGHGSMGRVYRAEHLGLARSCAIKVMNPGLVAKQPQIRERFWAEARAVANLLHPHVVTIHNLGSDRGYHFIEMEYVAGGLSLSESLIREGPFDSVRASTLVRQVVLALGAAHQSGMVHRDVKPSNVLLTAAGDAKLADFGLVRRISELERAGVPVAGTPTYMAPELFAGIPASHRSDIYAVGVMYYYLISARLPFVSDQMGELISLHRFGRVPDVRSIIPTVSDHVLEILKRCLAKHPDDRYQSAEDLADDLQIAVYNLRETEALVRESVEGLHCFIQGGRDNYRILFELPNDRLQEVYLEVSQGDQGQRILSVFSVCGPGDPKHYEFALKLNDKLTYGSLSIRNVNGQPMFVMTRAFARDLVCAADVRAALLEIARRADHVEMQLTNADLY
ncbi:serine/threonine protein kinase [Singulisphaera acidiphila]|uniref:Serine/threonine protein kinase n=1 Tax=Singulisphaera acidiphila (strain ATCC BAA-1392 / DSM 18658 / VKM B-2454 / MOB10) TaxID=886293 RepID=L0D9T8_SINAD|nr:serine/threonine-protein kinase [Singulisphaera acidiphila]AGA26007.1 serine/threonine protein kinase [Singulisphaera acidiphila DSM 18658]